MRVTNQRCFGRFDESYDDNKSGGYRDLSLNVEVLPRALAFVVIVKHPENCHAFLEGPSPSNAEAKVAAGGRLDG